MFSLTKYVVILSGFLFELFPKKETTHLARKKEQAFDLVVHTIYHELRFVYRFIYRKRADEAALHEYAKT